MKILTAAVMGLALAGRAGAEIRTAEVDYFDGEVKLEGYLAYDPALKGKRPGVVVFHEWTGLGPYEKSRADQLAKLGYVALAGDIYGKGVRPSTQAAAAAEAGKYRGDRALLRRRAGAALAELKRQPGVDPARTAVIGYCFGGGAALELARSGAALSGAASFHGSLDTALPAAPGAVKAKIAVYHGADDPFVSSAAVAGFEAEMRAAGADWQLVAYGGAVHRFSNPAAGSDVKSGGAYDEKADRRSWRALLDFFGEIFR
ncbi:MAG: dienelactone hydrolase [Elusimicrobia bacterium GWC2_64_44]|nr:MAG: dienelactone hydrolase [Elusimicrobia bacterium GWC2_64_44]